jgi:hypothetical protein
MLIPVSARTLLALGSLLPALASAEPPALRIDAPALGTVTRLPLVEVAGGAGRGGGARWDVAIVLDLSESTLHPSGVDLDGDGPGGRSDPALIERLSRESPALARRLAEIDFEDTILAAELEAADALLARTTGPRMRTGLIGFSNHATTLAPLGSSLAVQQQALGELRFRLAEHLRGTHYAAALEAAQQMLAPTPGAESDDTQRAIVFLSDGAPSIPVFSGDQGRTEALTAAREAGLAGIRLFAFAFGPEGEAATDVLAQMAEWTDGRAQHVAAPEQLVTALRELALVDVARLAITNATTGVPARAVRLFPDGSFDALVTLAEGENLLRVEAFAEDGSGLRAERTVLREPGEAGTEEAARGRALLEQLRRRTAEMEAWAEVERRRLEQRRKITIEAEPGR